jgi:hypothetical protein
MAIRSLSARALSRVFRLKTEILSLLALFEEPQARANDFARRPVATAFDLRVNETLEMVSEHDAGVLGHGNTSYTNIYQVLV